jgi:hypothetical protein
MGIVTVLDGIPIEARAIAGANYSDMTTSKCSVICVMVALVVALSKVILSGSWNINP